VKVAWSVIPVEATPRGDPHRTCPAEGSQKIFPCLQKDSRRASLSGMTANSQSLRVYYRAFAHGLIDSLKKMIAVFHRYSNRFLTFADIN